MNSTAAIARAVPSVPSTRDIDAFVALISSLSARLASAHGSAVDERVDECLRELLAFFNVEQCGIMEIQPNPRQARLRHRVHIDGVQPAPTTLEYGAMFPWTHERNVFRGEGFIQTCVDDLPPDALVDRASAAAIGVQAIISVPVRVGGQTTHVLCLTSSRPTPRWPKAIIAQLRLIAETFTAVLLRHSTEQALELSERTLAEAQRIAGVGSYVRDWGDDTLIGSDEANRIVGAMLGEQGRDLLDFVAPDDRARVREVRERALAERTPAVELEYRIVRPDGAERIIRSRIETTYATDGTPLRTLGTIRDVSELRAAEEESRRLRVELRHADRAAHAGALTASLSHELNQPLTGILANAQAGLRLLGSGADPELRDIFEAIIRDDKRAAAVVDNVRTLLRREEPQRTIFDLGDACAEVVVLFKAELEANRVLLKCGLASGCSVCAVRTQIQQVVLNLLANASQALRERHDGERRLVMRLVRTAPDRAEIRVSDSGIGIPAEYRDRIFDPFFTTRSEGLGMGLAICRSIVESHGGDIDAQPNAEGGVTFRFSLPVERFARQARKPMAAHGGHPAAVDARGAGLVCIVDDDVASRDGVARLLSAEGWSCAAFGSAEAALASSALASAHCIVLDVQMPGMSGVELHAELQRRGSATPIVFLSARSDASTGVDAMKRGAFEYLAKPVDEAVLVDAVQRAIERNAELSRAADERRSHAGRLAKLTARELDVLRQVIAGRLNKQIAAGLGISEATVKQHRGQVMDKMQVRSVADLVRACEMAGLDPS